MSLPPPAIVEITATGPSLNETIKTLRTKKLKAPERSHKTDKNILLRDKINDIVNEARLLKKVDKFRTARGTICVRPITDNVEKELLKHFSTREIREFVSHALKKRSL